MSVEKVIWRGNELFAEIEKKNDKRLRTAAKRAYLVSKVKAPVGRTSYTYKGEGAEYKTWKHRSPGSLRKTLRWNKSKFKGGGYIVAVGSYEVFYPRFVELGIPKRLTQTYRSGPHKGRIVPRIYGKHFLRDGLAAGKRKLRQEYNRKMI